MSIGITGWSYHYPRQDHPLLREWMWLVIRLRPQIAWLIKADDRCPPPIIHPVLCCCTEIRGSGHTLVADGRSARTAENPYCPLPPSLCLPWSPLPDSHCQICSQYSNLLRLLEPPFLGVSFPFCPLSHCNLHSCRHFFNIVPKFVL